MPSRMSDAELLEQTAEWLSRLAETIERVTERLADSISKLQSEQGRQADEIAGLSRAVQALTRADRTARLNAMQSGTYKPGE